MNLAKRMHEAAEVLEEVSALYGYLHPEHAQWTAQGLRNESEHVDIDEPVGLYEVKL
jgi:hypothetical protein